MFRKRRGLVIIKLKENQYKRIKEYLDLFRIEYVFIDEKYLLINRWDLTKLLNIYNTFESIIEI